MKSGCSIDLISRVGVKSGCSIDLISKVGVKSGCSVIDPDQQSWAP